MKILLYGECEDYGSGAWCYAETLRDMGHEVASFSPTPLLALYDASLPLKLIRKLRKGRLLNTHVWDHGQSFLRKAQEFGPEIVIVLKGLMIEAQVIRQLKMMGCWTVLINHDDFYSQFPYNTSNSLIKAVPEYNYVFCTKEVNVGEIKKLNVNTEMFLFAYYPKVHYPPAFNEQDRQQWKSQVVFIGNIYPLRTQQLEYLVSHIKQPIDLKIYGPNWDRKLNRHSPLWKYIQKRSLNADEMRNAIYYADISLGFLCRENRDDYTQRSFEVPACKGTLLAERTKRHTSFYIEDEEAVFFNSDDFSELVLKVELLLSDPGKRKQVAENGYNRVQSSFHTYKDRLERLLNLYNRVNK
ncbi:MAG: glycosyltransferase [Chitinophagaceae bacterium]|nr:glycosyltransferase [Chitinophagaceae bacterium]